MSWLLLRIVRLFGAGMPDGDGTEGRTSKESRSEDFADSRYEEVGSAPFRRRLRDTERRILRTVALGIFEPLKLRQDPLTGLAPRRDPTTPSYLLAVGVFWRSLFRLLPLPMAPSQKRGLDTREAVETHRDAEAQQLGWLRR